LQGGPPAALLVGACEQVARGKHQQHSRRGSNIDFVAPAPVGRFEVHARLIRRGQRVALAEATLVSGDHGVAHARTWLLRSDSALALDEAAMAAVRSAAHSGWHRTAPPAPQSCPPALTDWAFPCAQAVEWRHVSGDPIGPGNAAVWARPRIPVIAGEPSSGLQRAVLIADSGNGISAWTFVNVDLAVHLARQPVGDWILLEARTQYDPGGTGLSTSRLGDLHGPIGAAAQTLLVAPR
jgi:hypothetical protein